MILTILCGEKPGYTPVNKDSLEAVGAPCGAVEEFSICKIKNSLSKIIKKMKKIDKGRECKVML